MEEADWRKWFMCTCITCENGAFYFGRNLDLDVSFGEHVVITPRRFPLHFTGMPVLKEHYAMIGMAAAPEKFPLYAEAVNEKGLCMAGLNFPDNAVYRKEEAGMFNAASFEMIPWILGSCGSVEEAAELLASTFHELREGVSSMGHRIDSPGSVMSTAEAVSVYYQTMMNAYYYGDGHMEMDCMVQNLVGAVQKESREDLEKLRSYFSTVVRDKSQKEGGLWKNYYEARRQLK